MYILAGVHAKSRHIQDKETDFVTSASVERRMEEHAMYVDPILTACAMD
jgi:hypothetical protein